MLAQILSSAVEGIDAYLVEVEIDICAGLPLFTTVGLPETAVRESKERVKSAIGNSGYAFPDDRITVNLAPADIKKGGTGFDLPIAVGILAATGVVPRRIIAPYLLLGELSLDGRIKPVKGTLSMALAARSAGYKGIIVPHDNRLEASVVNGIEVYPAKTLSQVVEFFRGLTPICPEQADTAALLRDDGATGLDFSEVKGQEHVKRALEVAAAGGHNLLMVGPPGAGKTMLAKRISTILAPMTFEEALETTQIFSVAGRLGKDQSLVTRRPYRSPHHTVSDAGLIGGGRHPRPGEVSLAHNGILFLDELPEYKKHILDMLRQPLEDRQVTISRASSTITYPSSFMLIAAMNPCPCGFRSDPSHDCRCTHYQVNRYRSRISSPLLDRIDLHVEVPAVDYRDLMSLKDSEPSMSIRKRVAEARDIQSKRLAGLNIHCNAQMGAGQIKKDCRIDNASAILLRNAIEKLGLSARAYNRTLKIARTIADLAGAGSIDSRHVAEAIQYRMLDRTRGII